MHLKNVSWKRVICNFCIILNISIAQGVRIGARYQMCKICTCDILEHMINEKSKCNNKSNLFQNCTSSNLTACRNFRQVQKERNKRICGSLILCDYHSTKNKKSCCNIATLQHCNNFEKKKRSRAITTKLLSNKSETQQINQNRKV